MWSPNGSRGNLPSISHTLLVAAFWANVQFWPAACLTIDPSLVWFRVLALFYRDFGHVNGVQVSQKSQIFSFPNIHCFSPTRPETVVF